MNFMYIEVQESIDKARSLDISEDRKPILHSLIDYCQAQLDQSKSLHLNFICTHNSRRSQFSQVWAQVAASANEIQLSSYSGGIEVTACNPRTISSLERLGLRVKPEEGENPHYQLSFSNDTSPITVFSKLYDDPINPKEDFAAIMTCSDADENCPFIPGASARIPLRYEDPKAFDDTPQEAAMYDERSLQIASELFYVFGTLRNAD